LHGQERNFDASKFGMRKIFNELHLRYPAVQSASLMPSLKCGWILSLSCRSKTEAAKKYWFFLMHYYPYIDPYRYNNSAFPARAEKLTYLYPE
jgi:hypothetical protein